MTSPMKFDNLQNIQLQSTTQTMTNLQNTENHTTDQQQQQDPNSEYHPIMVNGQPALFIPATSAMSSSLFSQMMMTGNQMDALSSVENTVQNTQQPTFQDQQINNNSNVYNANNMNINQELAHNSSCNGMGFMNIGEVGNSVDNNVINNLENLNQNQLILNNNQLMSGTSAPQQVICIQPDGK